MINTLSKRDLVVAVVYGLVSFTGALVIIYARRKINNHQEVKMLKR